MAWITTLYLLSLVVWVGSLVFFSLIGAPSIFKALPPEYAGKAVAAIFPKYFPLGYCSGIVAFVCLIFSGVKTGQWPFLKILVVLVMVGLTVSNSLTTFPKATSLKEEIQSSDSRTDVSLLQHEFGRTHRWSMINNVTVLLLGLLLIFLTARQLTL